MLPDRHQMADWQSCWTQRKNSATIEQEMLLKKKKKKWERKLQKVSRWQDRSGLFEHGSWWSAVAGQPASKASNATSRRFQCIWSFRPSHSWRKRPRWLIVTTSLPKFSLELFSETHSSSFWAHTLDSKFQKLIYRKGWNQNRMGLLFYFYQVMNR